MPLPPHYPALRFSSFIWQRSFGQNALRISMLHVQQAKTKLAETGGSASAFPAPPSNSSCFEPRLKFVEHRRGITFFRCLLLLHLLSLLHFLLPSSSFFWWFFGLDSLRFPLTMTMTTFINIWGSACGLQLGQSKRGEAGAGQGMLAEWSRQTKQMRFSELPFCRSLVNRSARCALQGER